MTELESSLNTITSSNRGYNVASALQIRLETSNIIENIELFLRGAKIIVEQDPKTGKIKTRRVSIGTSRANDAGVQALLNWAQLILNPQVVQGNFPISRPGFSPMYEDYVFFVRTDLARNIINNCYNWEIPDDDIDVIIDSIMNIVEPFMTRLIDNKERDSYKDTIRVHEQSTLKEGGEGFKLFGKSSS